MDKLKHRLLASPWAIVPEAFDSLFETYATLEIDFAGKPEVSEIQGRVAVLPLRGTMVNRFAHVPPMLVDQTAMRAEVDRLAADKTVGAIVLDVDSGGGTVEGTPELSNAISAAAKKKPVIASVNGIAGSAAFWTISGATKVVASESSMVGSVGVIATHVDDTKALENAGIKPTYVTSTDSPYKAEGVGELQDETRAYLQERVDKIHDQFVGALAKNFGTSKKTVNADFGKGRMFYAGEAKDRGMIHEIGTMEDVLAELSRKQRNQNRARAARYRNRS